MSVNTARSFSRALASFASSRGITSTFFQRRNALRTNQFVRQVPYCNGNCFSTSVNQRISATNMSQGCEKSMDVSYNDILKAQKDKSVLIIDVREQSEIDETGKILGSIHIPMGDVINVLTNLSEKEFENKYGKAKPTTDTKIILSCRSGRRSAMVQAEIQKLSYLNSYNYTGGWLDWEKNQKA